jgi:4-hydroxybutyryl-CoA dehydratase/vinylacetyl-CoA-Delta-isomerase
MLMNAADYRESLRRCSPRVFVNGMRVESVADEALLAPGIAGVGVTYNFALDPAGTNSTRSAPRCSPSEFSRPA